MLLYLLTNLALAQEVTMSAGDLAGPAGGLLGGGAALALLAERFLRKTDDTSDDIKALVGMTQDLHDWHSKEDDDGVKVWYVRKSLTDAITGLAVAVTAFQAAQERQTGILDRIATVVDRKRVLEDKADGRIQH